MANNQQLLMGEGAGSAPAVYIEDVFSTYLYTGTGADQTITNGIDLATKGGMVWLKQRTIPTGTGQNFLFDSARGIAGGSAGNGYARLSSDTTDAQGTNAQILAYPFNSNGFSLLADSGGWGPNQNTSSCVGWTFRKQPKFFDVVTYTGNATTSGRAIPHNLGSTPGFVIIKNLTTSSDWTVWHRSLTSGNFIVLNTTAAQTSAGAATKFGNGSTTVNPTSTDVTVGGSYYVNASGYDYVMYVFAHDAGGFGLAGTDNVISCGSYTGNGSATGPVVTLGYEPQWIMIKNATDAGPNWAMFDNMRGIATGGAAQRLYANTSGAEATATNHIGLTATGFNITTALGYLNTSSSTYIYIAIRRGPMKVPTVGTSVFNAQANVTTDATKITTGFVTDWFWQRGPYNATGDFQCSQRLTQTALIFSSTAAEGGPYGAPYLMFDYNDGFLSNLSGSIIPGLMYGFRRAPSFFDEVCYTGTGVNPTNFNHNLGAVPELMIVKKRSGADRWECYSAALGSTKRIDLNTDGAATTVSIWGGTPTATQFSLTDNPNVNQSGQTNVAYLFATCAGVSKVGTYTGNGSSQTIACGFAAGSRFVLIKRTDSTGDWYVWDSARGIIAGNDPHLSLNTTAAEVTSDDSVDTDNSGFIVNQLAATNVNVTSATYIFLAIA